MTRTARRGKSNKVEHLPATPWHKLVADLPSTVKKDKQAEYQISPSVEDDQRLYHEGHMHQTTSEEDSVASEEEEKQVDKSDSDEERVTFNKKKRRQSEGAKMKGQEKRSGRKKQRLKVGNEGNVADDEEIDTISKKESTNKDRSSRKRKKTTHRLDKTEEETEKKQEKLNSSPSKKIKQNTKLKVKNTSKSPLEKKREARRMVKLKRRMAEKVCFCCRQSGHLMSECPKVQDKKCFRCGGEDHTTRNCHKTGQTEKCYPFATCFICKEVGHLARECPDNPKGLYPEGGGCRFCGSVEHKFSGCPKKRKQKQGKDLLFQGMHTASSSRSADADIITETAILREKHSKPKKKVIRF